MSLHIDVLNYSNKTDRILFLKVSLKPFSFNPFKVKAVNWFTSHLNMLKEMEKCVLKKNKQTHNQAYLI
ncbi:hypothetical protein GDO86_003290 [Hymenochirus boettgeri]|uniref:Uncharacterized protein n=1 Tax=Hymenochirus boettgeri TaxID=247094 RepID=A0A8T2K3F7_9PIPI|nr:hypothetical protein GDO86_003290 [Hymenochirus boettgeri]